MDQLLIEREQSLLLMVDVQEKLAPLCEKSLPWIDNIEWLLKIANKLGIACLVTEQYPKGLSHTMPQLLPHATLPALEKQYFSCVSDSACWQAISKKNCKQIILVGIESHVCILQTALHCIEKGLQVFVVIDAISAKHHLDHKTALKRMARAGVHLVTREMVVFEWLRVAGTDEFKMISKEFLR